MIHFKKSKEFQEWLVSLRRNPARARVMTRLDNATYGNFGDCVSVGNGVSEMASTMVLGIGFTSRVRAMWFTYC